MTGAVSKAISHFKTSLNPAKAARFWDREINDPLDLFHEPKLPKVPKPPSAPTLDDAAAEAARREREEQMRRGYSSTIATGGTGVPSAPTLARRVLGFGA
jgi:hypothetical protein